MEEVSRLLKGVPGRTPKGIRDRAILELLYASGLRVSEAAHLKLTDLNVQAGFLRCMGKGGRERVVPVGRHALNWIQRYLAQARDGVKRKSDAKEIFQIGRASCRERV